MTFGSIFWVSVNNEQSPQPSHQDQRLVKGASPYEKAPPPAVAIFWICSSFGLVVLVRATWLILWIPKMESTNSLDASYNLRLPEGFIASLSAPGGVSAADSLKQAFTQTYAAADELTERNLSRKRRVDTGQRSFVFGLLLIAAALVAYTAGRLLQPTPGEEALDVGQQQGAPATRTEERGARSIQRGASTSGERSTGRPSGASEGVREANPEAGTTPRDSR